MEDKMWNGYDAITTVGGMKKASILPIGEKGTCLFDCLYPSLLLLFCFNLI
jgi:hypothetical protein